MLNGKHPIVELADRLFLDFLTADACRKICDGMLHEMQNRTLAAIAPTYFSLTAKALFETSYIIVARLYDKKSGTVQLRSLLELADKKAGEFQNASPAEARKLIRSACQYLSEGEAAFKPIKTLRNKLLAHLDRTSLERFQELSKELDVSYETLGKVISAGRNCINAIRGGFDGVISMDELLDVDDYSKVFDLLREAKRAQIERYERDYGPWDKGQKRDLGMME